MAATVTGIHLGPDTHANRPAASAAPVGAFYYCSDHDLVYQTDGSSWSTWLDNTASAADVTADDAWVAKGDLLGGTGENTAGIVSVGANGSYPIADSGETAGIRWIKNNIGATAAPDADNDVDEGYEPGSRWVDTTNDKEYVCLDATDGAAVWTETTQSGGGGTTVHEYLYTPPGSEDADVSDEFDDESIDADWVRVDSSGEDSHLTWTEAGGVLSAAHDGTDAAQEFHGLVRPLEGLSHPASFVMAISGHIHEDANYSIPGIVLADGTTHGAGEQVMGTIQYGSFNNVETRFRDMSDWNTNNSALSSGDDLNLPNGPFFLRVRWTAANTFAWDFSPDGVSWKEIGSSLSKTITPTHAGICYSSYGGATHGIVAVAFFRAYDDS